MTGELGDPIEAPRSADQRERAIISRVLLLASQKGARLFRQNVGVGFIGKIIARVGHRVTLDDYRVLHAGLCKGSSDTIGWTPVQITPEMVGQTVAVFTAVEIKTGRVPVTPDQKRFIEAVRRAGGFAGVVRDEKDLLPLLKWEAPAPG